MPGSFEQTLHRTVELTPVNNRITMANNTTALFFMSFLWMIDGDNNRIYIYRRAERRDEKI